MMRAADGCFCTDRQRAYAHILVAVSQKAVYMLFNVVLAELSSESKNMRWLWILKASMACINSYVRKLVLLG